MARGKRKASGGETADNIATESYNFPEASLLARPEIIRLRSGEGEMLILETKGFDKKAEIKAQAAERWVTAVNAAKTFGKWRHAVARSVGQVRTILDEIPSI